MTAAVTTRTDSAVDAVRPLDVALMYRLRFDALLTPSNCVMFVCFPLQIVARLPLTSVIVGELSTIGTGSVNMIRVSVVEFGAKPFPKTLPAESESR